MELVNASLIGSRKRRPSVKLKFREGRSVAYSVQKGEYPYFYVKPDEEVRFPHVSRESGFVSYDDKPLDKISFDSIEDLEKGKRNVSFSMESDIPYLTRYLIDSGLTFGLNRRILYFDIEVERGNGSLDTEHAPLPITVIDAYDNFTQWHYPFVLRDYAIDGVKAFVFDNDEELLKSFLSFCKTLDFDVIIGWNSSRFDLIYMHNRAKDKSVFRKYHDELTIGESQPLDLMRAYREFGERGGRYFLDHVAYLVLGKRKDPALPELLHCIEDVSLTKEIDEKLKLSQLVFSFQNLVPLNTIDIMNRSSIIEAYLLKRYHNKYVLPNKGRVKHQKYKGALVREPQKGLHRAVTVLDFTSLYPSIVMHFNISPDRDIRNPGILTETIRELFERRLEYKKLYKERGDTQSQIWNTSYKFLLNACIGILGYSKSRFYNRKLAAEVTAYERKLLTYIWKRVEDRGIPILAGDTDALMIIHPEPIKIMNELNEELHKTWGEEFNLDIDKEFDVLFLYDKKKNYFGITKDGKLKITGTVVNRTSCPMYIRNALMSAYEYILKNEWKELRELKSRVQEEIKKQNIMDIAEWIRLSSVSPKVQTSHLKAAKNRLRLYRIPYYAGEKLPIVPTKDNSIGSLAVHEDIIDNLPEIDYRSILNKWFYAPLKEIEDILSQTDLNKYIGGEE
ncbi:hypothetical protein DRO24_00060 [Candidatus Bathyarchaeota archaeon]|nr:MAG: hypothetical protein DRO24_00060 [Candidatus Bathyarchaeota archaeon]